MIDFGDEVLTKKDIDKLNTMHFNEKASKTFYYILKNILHSFKILGSNASNYSLGFWIGKSVEQRKAYDCIKAIIGYFPEVKKMQKFL